MATLSGYVGSGFCEMTANGGPRPHYRPLVARFDEFDIEGIRARAHLVESLFRRQGITFAVYGEEQGLERTWPLDIFPRIISSEEWSEIETGLIQRVRALNAFLDDIYQGDQEILREGVVPRWLVESSTGYLPEATGVPVPAGGRCVISGIDLVRDGEGVYRVLEDNLRVPSGISYVLENRVAMTRVLPKAFSRYRVRPVADFGASLLAALQSLAPPGIEDPVVVVLTPGVHNSAYFEHAFLARLMGVELVEGRDLVVDGRVVYSRTTRGLARVDVIYRRVGDEFLDPVVFRPDSLLGVPGIMSAVRAGTVALANPVGNGAADDKGVYPYVPRMIQYYLGEEAILPNVETYRPWVSDELDYVVENVESLVIKPVAEAGGKGIFFGPASDEKTLESVIADIRANPRGFIAQEVIQLSTHPTFTEKGIAPRHIDLRPFVLSGVNGIHVVPGGLTRVALREGSLVVNSSQGGGSKDTWVLTD
ncbi:MAG TPA: circularly permuted type 2 ATP-grasp protein [Acidimicrobiia bacterium]|nr:circularly permuted type 2 ATP-grasp protein [Acidimicrobiia bacterium]